MRLMHALCAGIVSVVFLSTASAQQIGTYPASAVELQPGIFVCDTEASVLQVIASMSAAMQVDGVYAVPENCGELRPGIKGVIKYLKEYQDDLIRIDVVEYTLYIPSVTGQEKLLGTYYGYGASMITPQHDPSLPLVHI